MTQDSELDEFDRKIVATLLQEGRITITDLAERIRLSKTPCQLRLRRLIDAQVIRGFRAIVDPVRLGLAGRGLRSVGDRSGSADAARVAQAAWGRAIPRRSRGILSSLIS